MSYVPRILLAAFALAAAHSAVAQSGVHSAAAQPAEPVELQHIERAFSSGDVDALTAMASDRVEIAVFGRSRLYSRSQARFVLKDLFDQYPPLHFELSAPSRTARGVFAAGTYRYSVEEKPLRVYVRLRKSGQAWSLREILVDKSGR